MRMTTVLIIRRCLIVKMDVTLLNLLETMNSQPPELLSPGCTTMETTGLRGTCPVSLGRVNPGFTECRACRDTERKEKYSLSFRNSTLLRNLWPVFFVFSCQPAADSLWAQRGWQRISCSMCFLVDWYTFWILFFDTTNKQSCHK